VLLTGINRWSQRTGPSNAFAPVAHHTPNVISCSGLKLDSLQPSIFYSQNSRIQPVSTLRKTSMFSVSSARNPFRYNFTKFSLVLRQLRKCSETEFYYMQGRGSSSITFSGYVGDTPVCCASWIKNFVGNISNRAPISSGISSVTMCLCVFCYCIK